jgi:hypothetical protein
MRNYTYKITSKQSPKNGANEPFPWLIGRQFSKRSLDEFFADRNTHKIRKHVVNYNQTGRQYKP